MHFKSLALASLAAAAVSAQSAPSLAKLITSTPELSTLGALLARDPNAAAALANVSDYTVLAPSNDAFTALFGGPGLTKVPANATAAIEAVLTYHILQKAVPSSQFSSTPAFVPSFLTAPFANVTGGQVVEGVKNGSKVEIISGLKSVSTVIKADLVFTGGILHIIDKVLTIPERISGTAAAAGLTTLVELLAKTGLVTAVDETPDLTVFAPLNAAFEKNSAALAKLTVEQVATVLKAHVVAGAVGYSTTLKDGQTLKTLAGSVITITIKNGEVFANGVKVVAADVLVANGVVHVIEGILPVVGANGTSTGNGGSPKPTGTGTGTKPSGATGSPIVGYSPKNAASSVQAGWLGLMAMIFAGMYLGA